MNLSYCSALICSIFHLNWQVVHLIQFNVTFIKSRSNHAVNLSYCGTLICSIFHLNWRVAHLIQFNVTFKVGLTMQLICHIVVH